MDIRLKKDIHYTYNKQNKKQKKTNNRIGEENLINITIRFRQFRSQQRAQDQDFK